MARNLQQTRIEYNNRNKIYKANYVNNFKLLPDAISSGIFYSKDLTGLRTESVSQGNVKYRIERIDIETLDKVNLIADDFVLYNGKIYRVESAESEDVESQKFYSKRARTKTKIKLIRNIR